jgi:hypothetical protein
MIEINATNGSSVVSVAVSNAGFWFKTSVILVLENLGKISLELGIMIKKSHGLTSNAFNIDV